MNSGLNREIPDTLVVMIAEKQIMRVGGRQGIPGRERREKEMGPPKPATEMSGAASRRTNDSSSSSPADEALIRISTVERWQGDYEHQLICSGLMAAGCTTEHIRQVNPEFQISCTGYILIFEVIKGKGKKRDRGREREGGLQLKSAAATVIIVAVRVS